MTNKLIRLSKLISHAGICSRKNAEFLIKNGEVKINDNVFKEFFIEKSLIKSIKVKDKPLTNIKTRVWILNKPVGYVSSNKEQFSQKSLFRLVPKDLPRVVSVGRLDIKSEGLLLLTTNPKLSSYLEDPSNKIERRYIVKVSGKIPENLDKLVEGQFLVDGILYNEIKIKLSNSEEKNMMEVKLTEGKNREIRKVLNYFNLKVQKLKRISFGPFELNDIGIGNLVEIEIKFLDKLLNSIGFTDENNFRQI
ncbi:MAG: putative RNA pseudouridine synthase [Alphaproteobacteria bacterium]|nr:MAG: putative RNA pseudouridine synthase [Alphaproteobacteria bacterium]